MIRSPALRETSIVGQTLPITVSSRLVRQLPKRIHTNLAIELASFAK